METIEDFIKVQKQRMKELRSEMNQVMAETRERVRTDCSSLHATILINSVDVASWPEWMKSERLKQAEKEEFSEEEKEQASALRELLSWDGKCPKCKGKMIDLDDDGRCNYCHDCEETVFI
jgi:hypothetical protein